jgi:hypothetical protein
MTAPTIRRCVNRSGAVAKGDSFMNKPATPKPSAPDAEGRSVSAGPARPKFIVPLGRGARGKTWWTRWAVERAQDQGRSIVLADADRTNATLSGYFAGVLTPPSADDDDMRDWFAAFCEQQIEDRFTALVDLGGGDLMLKRIAREASLTTLLEGHGIEVVAVHLIGPDRDDLAYLRDMEADGLFAPAATILVLNEGLLPKGRSTQAAFQAVMENPIFQAAVRRGAKIVWMPRLTPAHEVDERRITFAAAEASKVKEGQKPIGPFNRQIIANWRRAMEQNFAPVAAWLP